MLAQPPLWFILLAFVLAIGPLVFVHELGHYLVARWLGVGAETFSIGFGREIAGWTDRHGTRWKVGWLPLGGYVKFVGDADVASRPGEQENQAPPNSFHSKPVWRRFLIVLAGPAANFLLAILIFAGFFAAFGAPQTSSEVAIVQPGSAAERAGIRPGDRVVEIGGESIERFEDIRRIVSMIPGEQVTIVIEREGRLFNRQAAIESRIERDDFGQTFRVGMLGIGQTRLELKRPSAAQLLPEATRYTFDLTRSMVKGLWQIISGRRSVEELGGPMKMAQIAGQQASLGLFEFIQLLALFSVNLGFINLLPVPMLDGGHLAFYAVEAVRRRPLSPTVQEWAFRGGLAALLTLLLFTTLNDLVSIGLWDRLERLIG